MPYTRRDSGAGFPENLRVVPGDIPAPKGATDWVRRHNAAIADFQREGIGATNSLQKAERAILGLAAGINAFVSGNHDGASDGYGAENITVPLIQAFVHALNYDLGRLDGGTLSDWAGSVLARCGLDDEGDFLPDTPSEEG